MVMNSWKTSGIVNTPWMHVEVLPQVKAALELRHALLPYLYTQMWRASAEHVPPIRPLLWDFAADPVARDIEDAFMLGADLLVAPVLEERETTREVYLPSHPGGWYAWHDGKRFDGGRRVTLAAPLGRLPLFARAGAIVPVEDDDGLAAVVFAGIDGTAAGNLYLDDGETARWREEGRIITLNYQHNRLDLGGDTAPTMRIRVHAG
jgi:alpha-glucosidase